MLLRWEMASDVCALFYLYFEEKGKVGNRCVLWCHHSNAPALTLGAQVPLQPGLQTPGERSEGTDGGEASATSHTPNGDLGSSRGQHTMYSPAIMTNAFFIWKAHRGYFPPKNKNFHETLKKKKVNL